MPTFPGLTSLHQSTKEPSLPPSASMAASPSSTSSSVPAAAPSPASSCDSLTSPSSALRVSTARIMEERKEEKREEGRARAIAFARVECTHLPSPSPSPPPSRQCGACSLRGSWRLRCPLSFPRACMHARVYTLLLSVGWPLQLQLSSCPRSQPTQ